MISFQPTERDWIDAFRLHLRWSANKWLICLGAALPLFVAGLLLVLNKSIPNVFGAFGVGLMSLTFTIWFLIPLANLVSAPMFAKRYFRQTASAADVTSVDWNDSAITFSAEDWHQTVRWQNFMAMRKDRKVYLFYVNDIQFFIVPRRAFTGAAFEAFEQVVNRSVPRKK